MLASAISATILFHLCKTIWITITKINRNIVIQPKCPSWRCKIPPSIFPTCLPRSPEASNQNERASATDSKQKWTRTHHREPFSNAQLMAGRALYPIIGLNCISECPFSRSVCQYKVRNCRGHRERKRGGGVRFRVDMQAAFAFLTEQDSSKYHSIIYPFKLQCEHCNTSRIYENILNKPLK